MYVSHMGASITYNLTMVQCVELEETEYEMSSFCAADFALRPESIFISQIMAAISS